MVQTTFTQNNETEITALLAQMTLAEKIGQMTQVDVRGITHDEIAAQAIGSVLSGGGGNPTPNTPQTWFDMVQGCLTAALRSRLGIPLLYGVDAVHGHNNLKGATIFPHNIGLGAARDAALVEKVARITALETAATGVRWDFAPTVAVPQDLRWGRAYEGFSEDTALVASLGAAYVRGLQHPTLSHPHAVLASVKHFVGDGGTTWNTTPEYPWIDWGWHDPGEKWSIDQGDTRLDEATLRAVHLRPYIAAIQAGARNIMVSYSSWNGKKLHAHQYLLTDVLKGELGFDGFLVSDWMAVDQIDPDFYTAVVTAIDAGLDMIMVPFEYQRFIQTLTQAVEQNDVSLERIDDAVRRILRVKFEMGLFDQPLPDDTLLAQVGSKEHRAVARQAVRQSLVLLKNQNQALPLAKDTSHILVAGQAADDIGLQCGGWTIEWMGASGEITPGTTLLAALQNSVSPNTIVQYSPDGAFDSSPTKADVGLVALSEQPYAEGTGDRADLHLSEADIMLVKNMRDRCQKLVVVLYSGRPLIITNILDQCDAFVAAWLPGTEGAGITDALFGDVPFTGKLPYTWPRSMDQIPRTALANSDDGPLFPLEYGLSAP